MAFWGCSPGVRRCHGDPWLRCETQLGLSVAAEEFQVSTISTRTSNARGETIFAVCLLLFMLIASALTTIAPVAVSVMIVFLFAGPHNYAEARYFLTRLPARMGRLKPFFLTSTAGVIILSATFPLLTRIPTWLQWPAEATVWLVGIWNTAFVLWCTTLIVMRSRQAPRYDWDYAWPLGIAVIGLTWLAPVLLPFTLVYAHPLMGLWILDRELQKNHPAFRKNFLWCVLLLPTILVAQWMLVGTWTLNGLQISPQIHDQITRHSDPGIFSKDVGQRLIATHAFLELLHYGIWLVAIPVVSGRVFSGSFNTIPLMKSSRTISTSIRWLLLVSAFVVVTLWLCFLADYSTTRDVYFAVATLHVLAEIPFLLRLL